MTYTLYGRPRWGSTLVEAQLVWYGLPFTYETVGDLLVVTYQGDVTGVRRSCSNGVTTRLNFREARGRLCAQGVF